MTYRYAESQAITCGPWHRREIHWLAFCLGIYRVTRCNSYLDFDTFLIPERTSPPDFDIDLLPIPLAMTVMDICSNVRNEGLPSGFRTHFLMVMVLSGTLEHVYGLPD